MLLTNVPAHNGFVCILYRPATIQGTVSKVASLDNGGCWRKMEDKPCSVVWCPYIYLAMCSRVESKAHSDQMLNTYRPTWKEWHLKNPGVDTFILSVCHLVGVQFIAKMTQPIIWAHLSNEIKPLCYYFVLGGQHEPFMCLAVMIPFSLFLFSLHKLAFVVSCWLQKWYFLRVS